MELVRLLWLGVSLVLAVGACARTGEPTRLPARFTGTFLQLTEGHGSWSDEDWRELFDLFQRLGLSQIVLQWSLYEGKAFYPSESYERVPRPPLEGLLALADERGMKVWVGLAHEESFWRQVEAAPDLVEVYLESVRRHALAVAHETRPLVAAHPSFAGWYIPQELDDVHWLEPERRKVLFDFLGSLSRGLLEETPGVKRAVSGFSNAHADPEALGRFWGELVRSTGIEVVLFQDGIGVGKLDLRHLPLYLEAVGRAVKREDADFWVVVESFRQVSGPPIDDEPFEAAPASIERLARQLEMASRHTTGAIIAFSIPEYLSPLGGEGARRLFEDYLKRLERLRPRR